MTQDRLAELAGLHPKYLGELERGRRNASLNVLFQLADALGVEPAELVGDDLTSRGRPELVADIVARLEALSDAELRSTARIFRRFGEIR